MKYGDSKHWNSSKQCLSNIKWLQNGTIKPIKTGNNTYDITKIDIIFGKKLYGIALEYNSWNNVSTIITCFEKTNKK